MNVLAISAHPDDVELGAGGTLAKHHLAGDAIFALYLTRGRDFYQAQGSQRAAEILGFDGTYCCNFEDQRLDTIPLSKIADTIHSYAEAIKPEVVYTTSAKDLNLDHQITNRATLTAFRPVPGSTVKAVYAYEVQSSTEWAPGQAFHPNVFVDIAGVPLHRKLMALDSYASEMRAFPHARSMQGVQALATWRGATVGKESAEAFELLRSIL